uniref:O-fucosyltransferase family protein n=1 Tax=Opuntia streptacantha TaxID=393608 RepID=A0A7C9EBB6_OPUST
MDICNCKLLRFPCSAFNSLACRCLALVVIVLMFRAVLFPTFPGYHAFDVRGNVDLVDSSSSPLLRKNVDRGIRRDKFLEVPQIVWGLNNQKIAFARSCLTARMLNRTLLMPSLSASLFYKEVEQLQAVSFDKIFQFTKFNSLCDGFVRLGQYSELKNRTGVIELQKGSGRKWTPAKDLDQLKQFKEDPYDQYEIIRIVGKNPFLWHDHWPVKEYARIFECVVLIDEIAKEADRVISRIRAVGRDAKGTQGSSQQNDVANMESPSMVPAPYMAVHMRIEKDWMIHCKNLEKRLNINEICSSKEEITQRVGNIKGLSKPTVVYLAVADSLLEDKTILSNWKAGLLPFEKKKLGVDGIYDRYPYLIKSAIDYEVCLRADIFVGNSFSTFSSLIVLDRTQKMIRMGLSSSCNTNPSWPSYAYNIKGDFGGPSRWMTNMSDISLQAISYGTNHVSC